MNNKLKRGAWFRVKYQTTINEVLYEEVFHPCMSTGSKLIDSFTSSFLKNRKDIFILDVKII